MTVGQLRQIAFLLNADVADLLRPPPPGNLGAKAEETLAAIERLTPDQQRAVLALIRSFQAPQNAGQGESDDGPA
mgnify:CR=1 FL=1